MIPVRQFSRSQLKTRYLVCIGVVAAVFAVLAIRLVYLQLVKGSDYRYQSENNRIRVERIPAPRGVIFDRNREILADTFAAFDAQVIPSELPAEGRWELYSRVGGILGITPGEIEKKVNSRSLPKWRPRLIKRKLTRDEMARMEARRIEFPGFVVAPNPVRTYPFGPLLGPVIGYMGPISPDEIELPQYSDYDPSDYLGRSGIERAWEGKLRGSPGGIQVQVDVVGRKYGTLGRLSSMPGYNIMLTVDRTLQDAAEKALGEEAGSVVAMEVGTGRILAMASRPGFDPNGMAAGVSADYWSELTTNPRHPLNDRPVQGTYAPGSTFKIVMALAGLDQGLITPSTTVVCGGSYTFGGRKFRCWKSSGHGTVNLSTAIEQSCDVYFYKLGVDLGVDKINEYSRMFGLGDRTGIELPGEKTGLIPSTEWKRNARKEPWYPGETVSVAIGQGYVSTTAVQLAQMVATVADPLGRRFKPAIVEAVEEPGGKVIEAFHPVEAGRLPFKMTHLGLVRDGLRRVVVSGTGKKAAVEDWAVAGKTGTAQVVGMRQGETSEQSAAAAYERRDHALFVCYAPYDNPKIAVAVIVEHGGHGGSAAAPAAQKVIKAYHDILYPPPEIPDPLGDEMNEDFVGPKLDYGQEEDMGGEPGEGD